VNHGGTGCVLAPTILKRLSGQSDIRITLFASRRILPGFWCSSKRLALDKTGERRWHAAVPMFLWGTKPCCWLFILAQAFKLAVTLFTWWSLLFCVPPCFWAVSNGFSNGVGCRLHRID